MDVNTSISQMHKCNYSKLYKAEIVTMQGFSPK